ncbi:MAG: hypothetical protein LAT62_13425 [Natronospirillum sp.]|uniref:hypothetical protein n=1 Tax=Natronospirillum sp. TaxID=2812955 RepID=UPI0025CD3436|nr:hypothetical protein [Natronospirillum sp.]MCH8552934.1 hypothetical protein [Natronospirillum sp.]
MIFQAAMRSIRNKFSSGNSVPVERAQVAAAEWSTVQAEIDRLQAKIDAMDRYMEPALIELSQSPDAHTARRARAALVDAGRVSAIDRHGRGPEAQCAALHQAASSSS